MSFEIKFILSRFRRRFKINIPVAASLVFFCLNFFTYASELSKLVLFGGGAKPSIALKTFSISANECSLQKIKNHNLIITWATDFPADGFNSIKQEFSNLIKSPIVSAPDRSQMQNPDQVKAFVEAMSASCSIFFIGGDQNKIMDVINSNPTIKNALISAYEKGIIFGGTSAGTAIMSSQMVSKEIDGTIIHPNSVELREGLGLLPPTILVDQHFIKRQRENRAFSVLLKSQNSFESILGVDEGAAVLVTGNQKIIPLSGNSLYLSKIKDKNAFLVELIETPIELNSN